jgi:dTDP-4-amino-4,6-dideoxygalactose transaminase
MSHTTQVPLMDPARGYRAYREEIDAAVQAVLAGNAYILGPNVVAFEKAFSQWSGVAATIGVANGTDAIQLALRTLEVGSGDIVFTVSHTAVATVAAVELAGATPVLIDVDPDTLTLDVGKLEDTLREYARSKPALRPRAVIAVHLYGHPCDLDALRTLCRAHELLLIEDCAQAHGARFSGRPVGTFGDAASFSFYPTKNLGAFGDGGATSFQSEELARRCRALREYGWFERYISDIAGMNSRLDELQAAILRVRLAHLDDEINARQRIAARYDRELAGILQTPVVRPGCEHSYHLYVVRTDRRDALRTSLQASGIGSGLHYPVPVHKQRAYDGRVQSGKGGLGVTEQAVTRIVSLPMHPFLTDDEVGAVIAGVKAWHERDRGS